jgi:hypothetical protein
MPRDRSTALLATAPPPPSDTAYGAVPNIPTTALVASAARYPGNFPRMYQGAQDWQRECYRHYQICGEARYAARYFGHALSRAVLEIARVTPEGTEILHEGTAVDLLGELFAGKDGQAQMLESLGIHLTVAGECYLVGRSSRYDPDDPTLPFPDGMEHDIWEIVSIVEMQVVGRQWSIKHEGYLPIKLTDDDVAIRIWIPDPAERTKAESPFKSLLPVLREIEWLTMHIFTQVSSRLAGAGLMFVNNDLELPPPPKVDGQPAITTNSVHALMMLVANAMEQSLKNPGSAQSRVPIIVGVDAEIMKTDIAKVVEFWSTLDDKARDMRNDSIKRFALGLEMPPEQLLGMSSNPGTGGGTTGGVSHWGAWQIEEQTIKMFIEPFLELIVNSITVAYLRPLMGTELDDERIVYNTSALRLRPDRSKEAMELYDRGLISLDAMLREVGFDLKDKMGEEELRIWLLKKIASGSATPDQVAAAAKILVEIDLPSGSPDQTPRESRPDPSLEEHPQRPRTPAAAALLPVAEALVMRVMERAGNRIRQSHKNVALKGVPAFEVHTKLAANGTSATVLEGAWDYAPQCLSSLDGIDIPQTVQLLNAYCLNLLTTQQPHTSQRLAEYLEVA